MDWKKEFKQKMMSAQKVISDHVKSGDNVFDGSEIKTALISLGG